MRGGKISAKYLKQILQSTYSDTPKENVGQYTLDKSLSTSTVLVYVDPINKEVKVSYRGTKATLADPTDWINNLLYATKSGLQRISPRYAEAKRVVDETRKKYAGYTMEHLNHSQGAIYSRDLAKPNESIVSVNPATKGEYVPNEQVIRSSGDAVSALGVMPSWYKNLIKEQKDITTSYIANPIKAHRLDILDELGDQMVGSGLKCPRCGLYIM